MHGDDWIAAYESQIPDMDELFGYAARPSRPKATKPSKFRAPKAKNTGKTQAARASAASTSVTNNSAEQGAAAGQGPSLAAPSAAGTLPLQASTTGNLPSSGIAPAAGSVRAQLPEFMERMTQAELRPVFKEKHTPYNIWHVTIQLMLLTTGKRKVWGTVEGKAKTLREARQAAAQEADKLVETSRRGAEGAKGAAGDSSSAVAASM